ncbi:glycosyltransferase family 4 protein [Hoyosella subflava]|uniref:Possible glycosyl transferase n=1 Tax=Hoyosella subflava (strain DSM 45089 / JCM 17490 / NBRC 109087 / DQS3-9A1) TaxID=443218 RepID=F6EJE4_HOYSD|nr:glycosyltransferase family 4 protein [Hoyosella subflava]AEF42560.1 Possible glycosyl transferase [Hoyosella subflava DQS3-9A1]
MREVLLLCWRDTRHPLGGGSERYLEEVGAALAARGVRVTLRTSRYRGSARSEIRDGMFISRGGGRLTVYPRALLAILAGRLGFGPLKTVRPDVVIDTQNGVPFFARLIAAVPVILLVHHCHREQWPVAGKLLGKLGWWIESWLSPRVHQASQYLTVSLPSAEELGGLGVSPDRIAVVRAGADAIPPSVQIGSVRTRSAEPRLCVLSRLVPHKQIEDALHAVARLRTTHPDVQLDVIGDGWWMQPLRDSVRELGIESSVTFHGHVSEARKHELLSRSWVHVMPSRKEGWGLAVIEAAQHGVPTVGYATSKGLTDSVIDGVTGHLVATPAELTEAIESLFVDAPRRLFMGEKARIRASEFSWDLCADGVLTVLESAAAGKPIAGIVNTAPSELADAARSA